MDSGTSRRKFIALTGAVGLTGLAGCGGGDGDTTTTEADTQTDQPADTDTPADTETPGGTTTTAAATDLGSVTVGILNPMTGSYSSLGPGQRDGAKLAVKQINASDEFNLEIDPVYEDTGTTAGTAQQAANRVVQQNGAQFVFGAISSSVALSLNEFAKSEELIYFPGGAAVPITGSACNEWVFRFETNTAQVAEAISAYTVNNLGTNVWFHIADYAYGDSVYKRTKSRMQAANSDFTEAGKTASQLGSSNFGSYISQISNSDADAVILGMTGGDLINFTSQAVDAGLKDQVNIVGPTMSFQVVRGALGSKAEGTYGGVRYNASIDLGDNNQFVQAFQDEHGGRPDNFERVGYDSVRLMARGMMKAGSTDPADAKEALAGGTFTTVLGDITLRGCDHQATNPTWMAEMVPGDGKMTKVETLSKTPGDEALPPCSDVGCNLG